MWMENLLVLSDNVKKLYDTGMIIYNNFMADQLRRFC